MLRWRGQSCTLHFLCLKICSSLYTYLESLYSVYHPPFIKFLSFLKKTFLNWSFMTNFRCCCYRECLGVNHVKFGCVNLGGPSSVAAFFYCFNHLRNEPQNEWIFLISNCSVKQGWNMCSYWFFKWTLTVWRMRPSLETRGRWIFINFNLTNTYL